jgi:hypothetical protein
VAQTPVSPHGREPVRSAGGTCHNTLFQALEHRLRLNGGGYTERLQAARLVSVRTSADLAR